MADFNPRGAPVPAPYEDPYAGWELIHRNAMTPAGVYQKGDETAYGWAVPGMISEPANALFRLMNTPAGTMPDPRDSKNQSDALTGLMALYGGNAVGGVARNAMSRGVARGRPNMEAARPVAYSNAIDEAMSNPNMLRMMDDINYADLNRRALDDYGVGYEGLSSSQEAKLRGWSDPGLLSDTGKPNPIGAALAVNKPSPDLAQYYDLLGLHPKGLLSEDIARAARDGNYSYYGVRITEDPLSVGKVVPESRVWDRDQLTDDVLDGTSTVGLKLTRDGLAEARKHVYDYFGNNVTLIGSDRYSYGADPGEWVLKDGVAIAQAQRPIPYDYRGREYPIFSDTGKPNPVGAALASSDRPSFTAYHGSPHDFDKFDMSKIGSGEGAQAYGHGLYFADSEGVAKSYRDALSTDGLGTVARGWLRQNGGDIDKTIEYLRGRNLEGERPFAVNNRQALAELEQAKAAGSPNGHMYQVRINADPNDFLDWDKPLSQQSENVMNALAPFVDAQKTDFIDRQKALIERRKQDDAAMGFNIERPFNIEDALYDFDNRAASDIALMSGSTALKDAGIPGIKYLDQGSRTAGEGSRNYVVFDDSLIEILKKYGLLAPGAAVGANALMPPDKNQ